MQIKTTMSIPSHLPEWLPSINPQTASAGEALSITSHWGGALEPQLDSLSHPLGGRQSPGSGDTSREAVG